MDYSEEKSKLKHALDNLKITKSQKLAEEILANHVGFEKEKKKFQESEMGKEDGGKETNI